MFAPILVVVSTKGLIHCVVLTHSREHTPYGVCHYDTLHTAMDGATVSARHTALDRVEHVCYCVATTHILEV